MGKETITKSTTVLKLAKTGASVSHFAPEPDEDSVPGVVKDLYMPNAKFEELGSPDTITVTVEPGDKLNG
jgi:hypothetical protein